jgi:hypothetical protein
MQKIRLLSLFGALLCLLVIALPPLSAQDATATPQPAGEPIPFNSKYIRLFIEFDQEFTGTACPEGSPANAFCLDVSGTGTSVLFGDLTLARSLVADIRGDLDEFDRASVVSSGTLTDAEGDTVDFALRGVLYPRDGTADYIYLITGGTGKFDGAKGHGAVLIPPPTSGSTGTEIWIGSLQLPRKPRK